MRAGLLRDYVTIQRNTPTQGSSGEEIDVWADLSNAWAFIRASGGDENIKSLKIDIRYTDVTHTDRIVFGTRIFDIVTVFDPAGMGRNLRIEAIEDV